MVSMLGGVMLLNHWMLTGLIWVIIMEILIVTSVAGELNTKLLSDVLGAERSQLYSLYHAMGIYVRISVLQVQTSVWLI